MSRPTVPLKINDKKIASPAIFQVDISPRGGRDQVNTLGEILRDRTAVKRSIHCEWPALTMDLLSSILQKTKDTYVYITYPDPETGNKEETRLFLVEDQTAPFFFVSDDGQHVWEGLKMNFIEK